MSFKNNQVYSSPNKKSFRQDPGSPDPQSQTVKKTQQISDLDLYKKRCGDLENALTQSNTSLEQANYKAKKAKELEQRVELILKQNSQLMSEIENVNKQFNLKKTESDIWKSKYENQMNTIIGMKANYELENKKLNNNINKAKKEKEEQLDQKQKELDLIKEKMFSDHGDKLEMIKRSHKKNAGLYEEQIRQLKDIIEAREQDIKDISNKLEKHKSDTEEESKRLADERDKHRAKIHQIEIDHQKVMQEQRETQDNHYTSQIEALKKLHQNESDSLSQEIEKLRKLICSKNDEIRVLIGQNKSQKESFDKLHEELKQELDQVHQKHVEHVDDRDQLIQDMKHKSALLHATDVQGLKEKHQEHKEILHSEKEALKELVQQKGKEIEKHHQEKLEQKKSYEVENSRLKQEIDDLNFRLLIQLQNQQKGSQENSSHIQLKDETYNKFENQMKNQIIFLESQIQNLKQKFDKKNNELDENIVKQKLVKNGLEDEIRSLRDEVGEIKKRKDEMEHMYDQQIENANQESKAIQQAQKEKIREQEGIMDDLENQIINFKEQICHKNEEICKLNQNSKRQDQQIEQLKDEIEKLNDKIFYLEEIKQKELEEQKLKIEQTNAYNLEKQAESHQKQLTNLNEHILQFKNMIALKDSEIKNLSSKYDDLEEAFTDLHNSQNQLEDYEKKIQLLGAEIVSTKSLYDVFVKSKNRKQEEILEQSVQN